MMPHLLLELMKQILKMPMSQLQLTTRLLKLRTMMMQSLKMGSDPDEAAEFPDEEELEMHVSRS